MTPEAKRLRRFTEADVTLAPGETKTVSASSLSRASTFGVGDYGYLYDVYTILKVDGTAGRCGEDADRISQDRIRERHGETERSRHANERLRATHNQRMARARDRGAAMDERFQQPSDGRGNGNLVRWMHITPWKQDVESCDRVGLMQAMPAGDSEKDVDGRRWEQRLEVMRDAIIYNRNNPSIIFYESRQQEHQRSTHGGDEGDARQIRSARWPRHRLARDARQPDGRVWRRDALHQQERATCRCGRWNIRATKACANIGTNSRRHFTRTATARSIATHRRTITTAIRIRMRSRMSCAGMTIGANGPAPASV